MSERILDVYLKKDFVGRLSQNQSGNLSFSYDEEYLSSSKMPISISLPLRQEVFSGGEVKAFFSGLLPEESVRDRLAKYLGVSEQNSFALLKEIGGDCAGALSLYPQGMTPAEEKHEVEILDDARLQEILKLIKRRPMLAGDDGYRLSLAGAQDKLAVGFEKGKVLLVKGGSPTTHIIKPIIDRVKDSAHNELFCMKLAKMAGLDVPEASLYYAGDAPYYLVSRYDRFINTKGFIERIHQEDFCQALGIAPEIKYEREGGPNIEKCQELITNNVARPALDQLKLLNIIIFNFLIGNNDAHGKNFSLLYKGETYKGEKPELSPAYDLLSTAVYPDLSVKMAMKIGGKYKPKDLSLRHFYKLVPDTKSAQSAMDKQIKTMTNKILDKADKLKLDMQKEGIKSPIFDEIIGIIKQHIQIIGD